MTGIIGEKWNEIKKLLAAHKKSLLVIVLFAILSAAMWFKGQMEAGAFDGTVRREDETGSSASYSYTYHLESGDDEESSAQVAEEIGERELDLTVSPKEPDEEEAYSLLEEAASSWAETYLGENTSAGEVRSDLNLPTSMCDGLVAVSYTSSDYAVLGADGSVTTDDLPDTGELVELEAVFSCGDYSRIDKVSLLILPQERGSAQWVLDEIESETAEAEEDSRQDSEFSLPETVAGYRIVWGEGADYSWAYFLVLGVLAAFCLEWRGRQQEKDYQKKRAARLEYEYPQMVEQFAVLAESGMTIRKAWERILVRGYAGNTAAAAADGKGGTTHPYLDEMRITWREIREGRGEKEAYERFGERIGLASYRKFASILTQNLSKGTRDMEEMLLRESDEALEMRKTRARKLGEEAGAKMLFPMLVMLVMILLILLLPALTSF